MSAESKSGLLDLGHKEIVQSQTFPWKIVIALAVAPATYILTKLPFNLWTLLLWAVLVLLSFLPAMALSLFIHSRTTIPTSPYDNSMIEYKDPAFKAQWEGKKVPVETFYEAFFAQKFDIKGDLLEVLQTKRYNFVDMVPTIDNAKWFLTQFIPELIKHTRKQDNDQVTEHYDRGNDFYEAFLGPIMIYTSGIYHNADDTLEEAQKNKMDLIANKMHFKKGDKHLDIGCGWGTFVAHSAKYFGTDSTGITIAKEQTAFAADRIKKYGVVDSARVLCMDYRDIPMAKYDKITCLEMAEHVGVRLFSTFLKQVYNMLNDDGLFYLQIAGLRRPFQYEDLVWGCFMGKYVFPGADASCPLGWVINQLEAAGFEIRSEETIGIHYSKTLTAWYLNWCKPENKKKITAKYGELWWRKWAWFLSWSVISSGQGSASCYMIVCHKNLRAFDRNVWIAERAQWKI